MNFRRERSRKARLSPCLNESVLARVIAGQYLEQEPSNSRLDRFIADGPTTTLQRLEGMTTGSLPTFIKVASNFNSGAITEDNWVLQLQANGWHTTVMGDDTWNKVASKRSPRSSSCTTLPSVPAPASFHPFTQSPPCFSTSLY